MTLADLKRLTANEHDWTGYLRVFSKGFNLPYDFNDTDSIIVYDKPYYQKAVQIVRHTPSHVLHNYIGFMIVIAFGDLANSQLRAINFAYSKAISGIKEMPPRWKECTSTVNQALSFAVSRLYVDNLVAPGTKKRAEEMIDSLKVAFKDIVETETKWLEETTRAQAIEKAAKTYYYIAYPEWMQVNAELDDYYGLSGNASVALKKGEFIESILALNRFGILKAYRELQKPLNITRE